MYRLRITRGGASDCCLDLVSGEHTLGRSPQSALLLERTDISRDQCRVAVQGMDVRIRKTGKARMDVDGVPMKDQWVHILPGQLIRLGKETELQLEELGRKEDSGTISSAALNGDPTRMGSGDASALQATGRPTDGQQSGSEAGVPLSEEREDKTRMQRTRIAAPGELDILHEQMVIRKKKRVLVRVLVVLGALGMVSILWPRKSPPEDMLSWPTNDFGEKMEDRWESTDQSYVLVYPAAEAKLEPLSEGTEGVQVSCRIGRDRDVEMTLTLYRSRESGLADQSLDQLMGKWIRDRMASLQGEWRFDRPSSTPNFLGETFGQNGIPIRHVPYNRVQDRALKGGVAYFFRQGTAFTILCVEVPFAEVERADALLYARYVYPTEPALATFWEGGSEMIARDKIPDALAWVKSEMSGDAPSRYAAMISQLMQIARRSALDRNREALEMAENLMAQVRKKQALWFNAQTIRWREAANRNDEEAMRGIMQSVQGVFRDPLDNRYFLARNLIYWREG